MTVPTQQARRMRIVFSTDNYSEGMGYSENLLPRALAARGHEVFVIASTMQVYGDHPFYETTYRRFLGAPIVAPVEKVIDGVTLIRLPILLWWKRFKIAKGRIRRILALKPDIVYVWDPRSYQAVMLSLASWFCRFKLFSGVHTVASVYPAYSSFESWPLSRRLYLRLTDTLLGWIAARRLSLYYAATPDAAEIAVRFFGARKESVRHLPLGLDTAQFHPRRTQADSEERARMRARLGFAADDIVCVYTGRLTEDKNPYCLAVAVASLRRQGRPFRALFLGEGEQRQKIASVDGCRLESFMPYKDLAGVYRAADVGVWPRQESISMTDAAACGLPLVVSDRMKALERIEGNGLTYRENDPEDLARILAQLEDPLLRARLGSHGAEKMRVSFSVERMAEVLLSDFEFAVARE